MILCLTVTDDNGEEPVSQVLAARSHSDCRTSNVPEFFLIAVLVFLVVLAVFGENRTFN